MKSLSILLEHNDLGERKVINAPLWQYNVPFCSIREKLLTALLSIALCSRSSPNLHAL